MNGKETKNKCCAFVQDAGKSARYGTRIKDAHLVHAYRKREKKKSALWNTKTCIGVIESPPSEL